MTHLANRHALIGGHRIGYGVYGAREPVVLVHGTPSSSYIWRADGLEVLAEKPDDDHRAHFREWLRSTHSTPANFDPGKRAAGDRELGAFCA